MTFVPVTTKRVISPGYFAELRVAYGPRALGVTGGGEFLDLYGYAWLALLDRNRKGAFSLYQAVNPDGTPWTITDPLDGVEWGFVVEPAIEVPSAVRHIALAFDQAGRPVVAYELTGGVFVLQWDQGAGAFITRGPWSGHDPVLVADAEAHGAVAYSNVMLYMLDSDRTAIIERRQNELYAITHTVALLTEPVDLDQVVAEPYRLVVYGQGVQGELVYRGGLYPVRGDDALGAVDTALPAGGVYHPVVVSYTQALEDMGTVNAHAPAGGIYSPLVKQVSAQDNLGAVTTALPAGGTYNPVVVSYTQALEDMGTVNAHAPADAIYSIAVTTVDGGADTIGTIATSIPTGGEYV